MKKIAVFAMALILLLTFVLPTYSFAEETSTNDELQLYGLPVMTGESSVYDGGNGRKLEELNVYMQMFKETTFSLDASNSITKNYNVNSFTQENRIKSYDELSTIVIPSFSKYIKNINLYYQKVIKSAGKVNEEIQEMHNLYNLYLEDSLEGYKLLRDILNQKNFKQSDVVEVFAKLGVAYEYYKSCQQHLDDYKKAYGIPVEEPEVEKTDTNPKLLELSQYKSILLGFNNIRDKAVVGITNYNPVTEDNRKAAYISFNTVVVPNYTTFVYNIKQIMAPNEELKTINNTYIKGLKLQLEGYTMFKDALYKKPLNAPKLAAAWKKVYESEPYLDQVSKDITAYEAKYARQ